MKAPTGKVPGRISRRRSRVVVAGIVQGVGFRPFVYRLAVDLRLDGFVRNDPGGVTIEIEGAPEAVERFLDELAAHPPPLARIESLLHEDVAHVGEAGFAIVHSEAGGRRVALVSPDVATCPECRAEIRDPAARRHGYAFTNCTNCGPRFTITLDIPYDRPNTTMAPFAMCEDCLGEYTDPLDRRFHAQPIACPVCGPSLRLLRPDGSVVDGDPIEECNRLLRAGEILAIKGLGGYHLACDATNEDATSALRSRKVREDKPFALMAPDLAAIEAICRVTDDEAELLTGHRRPIVLLERRPEAAGLVAGSVAPANRFLGFMLPYTPLHHLLLAELATRTAGSGSPPVLVMTSGNVSDEPIAYRDGDALERLADIADAFLVHDREIHIRCDDSVTRSFRGGEYLLRRSRGYAPEPLPVATGFPEPVLAVGAELKHTFCLGTDRRAFVSHHIGDLENWETMRSFLEGVEHFSRIFEVRPRVIAHDLHPEYLSTKWALAQAAGEEPPLPDLDLAGAQLIGVQHHHAHIASCLIDNGLEGPVIGLALDGTGWGSDSTIWGCEVLVCDLAGFERVGHLRYVPLAGGASAIKEPWRMAAVYLAEAFGDDAASLDLPFVRRNAARWGPVLAMARRGINAIPASSAGRLFDAAAALAGVRERVNYEGQGAIEWEQAADPADVSALPCPVVQAADGFVLDGVELIRATAEELGRGTPLPRVSAAFHSGFARALVEVCGLAGERAGLHEVALSGGTFQNLLLLERVTAGLEEAGLRVHRQRRVPANDGGISLGQAAVAAARLGALS